MKLYSIRLYVVWLTLIPLLVMAIGFELYFVHERSNDLDHDLEERGKLIAHQLASGSEYGVFANNQAFLQNLAQSVLQQPDVRGVMILNAASESIIEAGKFSDGYKGEVVGGGKKMLSNETAKLVNAQNPISSIGDNLWIYQPIIPAQVSLDDVEVKSAVQPVGAVIIEMSRQRTENLKWRMLLGMSGAVALLITISLFMRLAASRRISIPVCELSDAVQRIANGHLETRVTQSTHVTELNNLAGGINNMTARLQQDITELKNSEQQLHNLSMHLQAVREEEKSSIAREIHDHLGGTLTALKMDMNWLMDEMSVNKETPLLKHVESMAQLLDEVAIVTRRIITDLRPTILDDLGLCAALEWQAGQFQQRSGIQCSVICCPKVCKYQLNQLTEINLFRIFQESLTNVARHSGASKVEVDFRQSDAGFVLTISDNGCGLPQGHTVADTSFGMLGMRERVQQLGGTINFDSPPGGGLTVTVLLPPHVANNQREEKT